MSNTARWDAYFAGRHEDVIRTSDRLPEAIHITGLSLVALGRIDEGLTVLMASTMLQPRPDWFANACIAFLEAQRPDLAKTFALTGLGDFPTDANLNFNAGNVYTALGYYHDAVRVFGQALESDPAHWEAQLNLANTYRRLNQMEDALAAYDKLEAMETDDAGRIRSRLNRGVTLCDLGHEDEALAIFDELAASSTVKSPEMDFNRATLRLKLGDYEQGWKLYGNRWLCPMAAPDVAAFRRPMLASLEEGRGKHVLLCHEQGFGDSIQFIRYAPLFADQGISVTILVPQTLKRLFEQFGLPVVTTRDEVADYDFECPMLNCPTLFGTTLDTIPFGSEPYLFVPPEMIEEAANTVGKVDVPQIGVVWAGQSREAIEMKLIDQRRSLNVEAFKPLFELFGAFRFVSLQFGDRADDMKSRDYLYWPRKVLQPGFDFLDTAAVIMNLDLVITVDTSTAHLAAALGKPVWLLSRFDGCWRWLKDRDDSPWYKDVTIFQQEARNVWSLVIEDVKIALQQRAVELIKT